MLRGPYRSRSKRDAAPEAPEKSARELAIEQQQRDLFALKRALKVKRARNDLRNFIELMWPDPEYPDDPDHSLFDCEPHHKILIEMVEKIERRELMRAGCSMPPQHGKSLILSRFGLAWILGRNPHLRVLFATYNDKLAETRGDELRSVLEMPAFREVFPKAALKRGSRSKSEMVFQAGGSINLIGRGSGATGRPADLFLIDDPYKDSAEADSDTIREDVRNWYSGVVQTRCPAHAPILIVHTRWNEDDLLGWLCDKEHPANQADPKRAARWKYVNLPTPVNDEHMAKALGLPVGSALWPKRFPIEHLEAIRSNDERLYAALYLGEPAPLDGDFFKAEHWQTYLPHELPKKLRYYSASDHGLSEKTRADPTCMGTVGVCEQNIVWVLPDLFWDRVDAQKQAEAMLAREKRRPSLWWRAGRDHITGSIGPFLRRRMLETNTFINLIEEPEKGDKVSKAQAIQARMAAGAVRFPAGAPWLMKARTELLKFPHAKHDDFVDFLSLIGRGLRAAFGAPRLVVANDDRPKTGTLNWIKGAAKIERETAERRKRIASL